MARKSVKSKDEISKKEKFLEPIQSAPESQFETKEPEPNKWPGVPFYLLFLVFLFGVLFAFSIFIYFGGFNKIVVNDSNSSVDLNLLINDLDYRTVPVTMVYSKDCAGCDTTNTFETLFVVRKIPYKLEKVEASSEEGKALVEKFGLSVLPSALIDAEKLKFYPKTVSDFDLEVSKKRMKKVGRVYVAPELNLDNKVYYPVFFLNKPSFCSSSKPSVFLFDDYYAPQFSYNRNIFYDFVRDFNGLVDIGFFYAHTGHSADKNSQMGNIALYCASQQGKFVDLEMKMSGIYCNNPFAGDETELTSPEINGCWTLSNHFGKPLNDFELGRAINRANLDINKFKACFDNKEASYFSSVSVVEKLGFERTGLALVDCQETVEIFNLKKVFCAKHPDFEACGSGKASDGS